MATPSGSADPLSATCSALADPTRRAILARLVDGEAPVTERAAPFEMSMPAVSKHLKVLERAGLIERSRHAQWRPCRLAPAPLKEVADWVERYRQLWEERPDRVDDFLAELQLGASNDRAQEDRLERRDGSEEAHDGGRR